jgi:ethanolamine utilization protein EutN
MIRARVVGEVWATRRAPGLDGRRLLLCAQPNGRVMVAIDVLDAREGQEVLVSVGSGARNVLEPGPNNRHLLADAAISLLVDGGG